jgi:hypothetical protein
VGPGDRGGDDRAPDSDPDVVVLPDGDPEAPHRGVIHRQDRT